MAEEYNVFIPDNGLYPGRVCRLGKPADWTSIRDASLRREQSSKHSSPSTPNGSVTNLSHSSRDLAAVKSTSSGDHRRNSKSSLNDPREVSSPRRLSDTSSTNPTLTVAEKLEHLLSAPALDLAQVKKLAWAGLPSNFRAPIWKILLGYLPTNLTRRKDTLSRRRSEYWEAVEQHYASTAGEVTLNKDGSKPWKRANKYSRIGQQEDEAIRQISIDLPRTCPGHRLFHIPEVQLALERILYVWATRHPASGYVQGMNDLVTPFIYVFLAEYVTDIHDDSILGLNDLEQVPNPEEAMANVEADAYWCLTTLLSSIQDYYTFSQPGIQRRVIYLRELVARVDSNLCTHLKDEGLNFLQFAFRWMNCLLMRELPFPLITRVWDTYLAESDGFAVFHVYVCAALLVSFSDELQEMDFQDLVMFLQNLPTESWTSKEIDVILSQAYMWRTIFGAAPSHLQ